MFDKNLLSDIEKNFVGREDIQAKLIERITKTKSSYRRGVLLRVWGPAGIGKTFLFGRLYLHVTNNLSPKHICLGLSWYDENNKKSVEAMCDELVTDLLKEIVRVLPEIGTFTSTAWTEEFQALPEKNIEATLAFLMSKIKQADQQYKLRTVLLFDEMNWFEEEKFAEYCSVVEKLISPAVIEAGAVAILAGRYPVGRNLRSSAQHPPRLPEPFDDDIQLVSLQVTEIKELICKWHPYMSEVENQATLNEKANDIFAISTGYPLIMSAIKGMLDSAITQDETSAWWATGYKALWQRIEQSQRYVIKPAIVKMESYLAAFHLLDSDLVDAIYKRFYPEKNERLDLGKLFIAQTISYDYELACFKHHLSIETFLRAYEKHEKPRQWSQVLRWGYRYFLNRVKTTNKAVKSQHLHSLLFQAFMLLENDPASEKAIRKDLDGLNIKFQSISPEKFKKGFLDEHQDELNKNKAAKELLETWLNKLAGHPKSLTSAESINIDLKLHEAEKANLRPVPSLFPYPAKLIGMRSIYLERSLRVIRTHQMKAIQFRGLSGMGKTELLIQVLNRASQMPDVLIGKRSDSVPMFDFSDPDLLEAGTLANDILNSLNTSTKLYQANIWVQKPDKWIETYNKIVRQSNKQVILGMDRVERINKESAFYNWCCDVLPKLEKTTFIFCEQYTKDSYTTPSFGSLIFQKGESVETFDLNVLTEDERREYIQSAWTENVELEANHQEKISTLSYGYPVMLSLLLGLCKYNAGEEQENNINVIDQIYKNYEQRTPGDELALDFKMGVAFEEIGMAFLRLYRQRKKSGLINESRITDLAIIANHGMTKEMIHYTKSVLFENAEYTDKHCDDALEAWIQEHQPLIKIVWGKGSSLSVSFQPILRDCLFPVFKSESPESMESLLIHVIDYYEKKLLPTFEKSVDKYAFAWALVSTMGYKNILSEMSSMYQADASAFFRQQTETARRNGHWILVNELRNTCCKEFLDQQHNFCELQDIQHDFDKGYILQHIQKIRTPRVDLDIQDDILLKYWLNYLQICIKHATPGQWSSSPGKDLYDALELAKETFDNLNQEKKDLENLGLQGDLCKKIAELSMLKHRYDWAENYFVKAIDIFSSCQLWSDMIASFLLLIHMECKRGRAGIAWQYLNQASKVEPLAGLRGKTLYSNGLATLSLFQGDFEKTLRFGAPFGIGDPDNKPFVIHKVEADHVQMTMLMATSVQLVLQLLDGQKYQNVYERIREISGNHQVYRENQSLERIDGVLEGIEFTICLCDFGDIRSSQHLPKLLDAAEANLESVLGLLDLYKPVKDLLTNQSLRRARALSALARLLIARGLSEANKARDYFFKAREEFANAQTLFETDLLKSMALYNNPDEPTQKMLRADFIRTENSINMAGGLLALQEVQEMASGNASLADGLNFFELVVDNLSLISFQPLQVLTLNSIVNTVKCNRLDWDEVEDWLQSSSQSAKTTQFHDILRLIKNEMTWMQKLPGNAE